MTTDTEVVYESNTVRVVRGMESRTIQKWEGDGWELVSQTPGKLRTELTFRRPKPKSRRLLWIIGASAFAVILATIITIGVISEKNAGDEETAAPFAERIDERTQRSGLPRADRTCSVARARARRCRAHTRKQPRIRRAPRSDRLLRT